MRLSWWSDAAEHEGHSPAAGPGPAVATALAGSGTTAPPPLPAFASSSYFAPRSAEPAPHPVATPASAPAPVPPPAASPAFAPAPVPPSVPTSTSAYLSTTGTSYVQPTEAASGSDWKKSALDRFKKMPDGSKYRR